MVTEVGDEVRKTATDEQLADGLVPQLRLDAARFDRLPRCRQSAASDGQRYYRRRRHGLWADRAEQLESAVLRRPRPPRFSELLHQLGVFAKIAGALLLLNVAQRWLAEMIKLRLREGLAGDLVREWLQAAPRFPRSVPRD